MGETVQPQTRQVRSTHASASGQSHLDSHSACEPSSPCAGGFQLSENMANRPPPVSMLMTNTAAMAAAGTKSALALSSMRDATSAALHARSGCDLDVHVAARVRAGARRRGEHARAPAREAARAHGGGAVDLERRLGVAELRADEQRARDAVELV